MKRFNVRRNPNAGSVYEIMLEVLDANGDFQRVYLLKLVDVDALQADLSVEYREALFARERMKHEAGS